MLYVTYTIKASKVGSIDGHNFQTPSSPHPEVKRFTLSSRKAVAIAPTELGPVTKKPPDLPVTIVTPTSYAHSFFSRYFPIAGHPIPPSS